jgi:hypothetical protein
MKTFGTWVKKIAKWYQEVDSFIQSVPKLLLYIICGSIMLFGFYIVFAVDFPTSRTGAFLIILPPIFLLRGWIIAIFSSFWRVMVKPFFLWILWVRTQGFSVLLTYPHGAQLIAVIFTFFVLYQFQILQSALPAILIIAAFFAGLAEGSWDEELFTGLPSAIISTLLLILVTAIPGFIVGLLTDSKAKGMNSVGLASFLVTWANFFLYWAPEMFCFFTMMDAVDIFIIILSLIGMTILSFVVCGIGMGCGWLGGMMGSGLRREISKTGLWKLKEKKEALVWELEDQLKELDEELGRGVISQEEYEQKKKKLLEKSEA